MISHTTCSTQVTWSGTQVTWSSVPPLTCATLVSLMGRLLMAMSSWMRSLWTTTTTKRWLIGDLIFICHFTYFCFSCRQIREDTKDGSDEGHIHIHPQCLHQHLKQPTGWEWVGTLYGHQDWLGFLATYTCNKWWTSWRTHIPWHSTSLL